MSGAARPDDASGPSLTPALTPAFPHRAAWGTAPSLRAWQQEAMERDPMMSAEALAEREAKIQSEREQMRKARQERESELQRKSDSHAEWSVRFDRSSERDRLCDWLRWQKPRFGAFLEHAAEHGTEALTRKLVDEMFETERRIKKEGRGAGGLRPLRMWRGD